MDIVFAKSDPDVASNCKSHILKQLWLLLKLLPSADDKQLVETLPDSPERDGMLQLAKQLQNCYRETQSELLEVTGLTGHQANNEILMREIKARHFS